MSHDLYSSLDSLVAGSTSLLVCEASKGYRPARAEEVLQAAQGVLARQVRGNRVLASPNEVKDLLRVRMALLTYEVFAVLHLDIQNRLVDYVEMFRGTLTQTSVYPREVVKDAMQKNTASVVLVHNHPSGSAQPSRADEVLTQILKSALALVDVRVLDHMIVAGNEVLSMAERGLI